MGMPMYLLRITPEQAALDGDALVRLLPDYDEQDEAFAALRLVVIDTAWQWLDVLFRGDADEAGDAALPILGGRSVERPSASSAVVLDAPDVARAAEFLANASFDQLLAAHRGPAEEIYGGALDEEDVAELRQDLADLAAFYNTARANGDAVLKWVVV
jgi:hypothetical protein